MNKEEDPLKELRKQIHNLKVFQAATNLTLRDKLSEETLNRFQKTWEEGVMQLITQATEHIARAYGGCKNCYGKSYASVNDRWYGPDTDGDIGSPGGYVSGGDANAMKFCTCERGKELERRFKLATERAEVEAVAKYITTNYGERCETKDTDDFPDLEHDQKTSRCLICMMWEHYDDWLSTLKCVCDHDKKNHTPANDMGCGVLYASGGECSCLEFVAAPPNSLIEEQIS